MSNFQPPMLASRVIVLPLPINIPFSFSLDEPCLLNLNIESISSINCRHFGEQGLFASDSIQHFVNCEWIDIL